MSVSCFVYYKDGSQKTSPVAGEGEFATYWAMPALAMGLNHVPQFSEGLWIYDIETLSEVIDELGTLKAYWDEKENNITWPITGVRERIDRLIELLQETRERWEVVENVMF